VHLFQLHGDRAVEATSLAQAKRIVCDPDPPSRAVIDLRLDDTSGLTVLESLRLCAPNMRIVLVSGYLSVPVVVEAMRLGAIDCIPKNAGAEAILAAFSPIKPQRRPVEELMRAPSLERIEWEHIHRVLIECGESISEAARVLGISRRSLQRKLRRAAPR